MSILQKLTVRHLLQNRKRTAITVVGIALSVAMVTAVAGMVVSFQDLLYRDSVEMEGLWHVRYADVPTEIAQQLVREPVFSEWEWTATEDGPVLSMQFARLHKGIFDESEAVCFQYGIAQEQVRFHNNLLIAKGIVPGPYYTALYTFAGILLALIGVGSILVISNAFTISSDQRSVQFGLLKSVGATKDQIRDMVLFEGIALLAVSIPIGILAGFFAQWVALSIANRVLSSMDTVNLSAWFRVIVSPAALGVASVSALLTVLLAAWFPARKASRASAVEAVRQTRSIQLSDRQVRVFPLTGLLFGFEGLLAAKTLRRNRGKYRTTVLALVVSIVLFIGVSSFGDILVKATTLFYEDSGSNAAVSLRGGTTEQHNRLAAEMAGWEGVRAHLGRLISGRAELPESALSEQYRVEFPDAAPALALYSIGARDYDALYRKLDLETPTTQGAQGVSAILVNTTGTYIRQGRRMTFVPYRLSAGDRFSAWVGGQETEVQIAAATEEILPGLMPTFYAGSVNLIVSDAVLEELRPADQEDHLWVAVMADDAESFARRARELLEEELPSHTWSVMDYEKAAANNRNISALVMLFVYGFIGMLSLIGVTSVITTISTSIALRRREFAMLRSVGMTEQSIRKMLRYESLLYGIRALLWGIPLGLITCGLLYQAMTSVMDFPFIWPVRSIAISVAAILLLTLTTMAFAWKKHNRVNIAEVLRDDIV